ncbi:MAG: hypothetical protein H8F28_01585 [Fibrella sp.]|nr:hypothetical protein [Armatimonadota bacterium]
MHNLAALKDRHMFSTQKRRAGYVTTEYVLDAQTHEPTGGAYSIGDTALPRGIYESLTDAYPALIAHPDAPTFRRLARYLLFSPFKDVRKRVITPSVALQKIARVPANNHRFHARRLLDEFSQNVWPLTVREPRWKQGMARTVDGDIPEPVRAALDTALPDPHGDRVWLGSGRDVTRGGIRAAGRAYRMELLTLASGVSATHPARGLLDFLNALPTNSLRSRLNANWEMLTSALESMPTTTRREQERRRQAQGVLFHIKDGPGLVYSTSHRTPRAFALGLSVNGLPRELRKIALRGCVELDARACQLSVVARLWVLPTLTTFLESRRSVWSELTGHLGLDQDEYKSTVKRLIYGIVFGAREISLRRWMGDGDAGIEPISEAQADDFLRHPLVSELLAGRDERLRQIRREKAVVDAFGQRLEYDPSRDVTYRSLLAQEVQSYEVTLMLSLLPRIQRNLGDVHLLSWLHDGVSLWFSDKQKAAATLRGLCGDFARAADQHGFLTELEVAGEPPFDLGALL